MLHFNIFLTVKNNSGPEPVKSKQGKKKSEKKKQHHLKKENNTSK